MHLQNRDRQALKLRLPRRPQHSFQRLRHPFHDQLRVLLCNIVRGRENEKITVSPVCHAAARDDGDADFAREAFGVDGRCDLIAGWEGLFGCLIFDELDLDVVSAQ